MYFEIEGQDGDALRFKEKEGEERILRDTIFSKERVDLRLKEIREWASSERVGPGQEGGWL